MSNTMVVLLNDIVELEYDREKPLPEQQRQYLEKMDKKMDIGITLDEQTIAHPDGTQRAQFVAQNLAQVMKTDDESMMLALTSWLASRLPELKQVKFEEREAGMRIELVFDEEYSHQVAVSFSKLH